MNKITYEERCKTYMNDYVAFGLDAQCVVAVEELSECQKEICKMLRNKGDLERLSEEIADATIMLEQMRLFFGINDAVNKYMDEKIKRLDYRLKGDAK